MAALAQPHRSVVHEDFRSSEWAATTLGQLRLQGLITPLAHEAGERFQVIMGEYLSSIMAPTGGNHSGKGYDCIPDACRIGQRHCECQMRKERFRDALSSIDRRLAALVVLVAVQGEPCPGGYVERLAEGLQSLVKHFKLDARSTTGAIRRYGPTWRPGGGDDGSISVISGVDRGPDGDVHGGD